MVFNGYIHLSLRGQQPCKNSCILCCRKLPCPLNRFLLKVITETEVSKHLKESMMPSCSTHIFHVICAYAPLSSCSTWHLSGNLCTMPTVLSIKILLNFRELGLDLLQIKNVKLKFQGYLQENSCSRSVV